MFLELHLNAQTKALLELLESTVNNQIWNQEKQYGHGMVLCLNMQILQLHTSNEATQSSAPVWPYCL